MPGHRSLERWRGGQDGIEVAQLRVLLVEAEPQEQCRLTPPSWDHVAMLSDLLTRLDSVEARLAAASSADPPPGLTEPDPDGVERWEAGQVWAHMAEFVPYWTAQAEYVIGQAATIPVPFGRVKTDPDRMTAIERDRHTDPVALLQRVRTSLAEVSDAARALPPEAWTRRGAHPTRGEMSVQRIIERFIVEHLEEHADQLDALVQTA